MAKILIFVAFVLVHSMATAIEITETSIKGKREAPMAEPSTDYIPPRLEAPYATFAPIQLPQGENVPQASIFVNAYGIPMGQSPYLDRIPAVPAVPGADTNANDIDTALNPPPQPYNNLYDGPIPKYQSVLPLENANGNPSSFGNYPNLPNYPTASYPTASYPTASYPTASYPTASYPNGNYPNANYPNVNYPNANSLNLNTNFPSSLPTANYPNSNYPTNLGTLNNNAANHFATQGSTSFYRPQYAGLSHGYPSTASLVSSQPSTNAYTSSAALISKQPAYSASTKSLSHFASSLPMAKIYSMQKAVKNSRPMALTPSHLQRRPQSSFASDASSQGAFRPSFLLGSQYVTSTADYKQPTHTSLGTTNQFLSSPQSAPSNQYVTRDATYFIPPGTSYGVPETPFYMRESLKSTIFGMPYGKAQIV